MSVDLLYDVGTPVWHEDAAGMVPTSATLSVVKPDGTALASPTVTLPTVTATVQASTTASAIILDSAAGFAVGQACKVVSDGVSYVFRVARIDSATIYPVAALPQIPDTGATVSALRMTATVAAPGEANVGDGYALRWEYTDGTTTRQHAAETAVVRWLWQTPIEAWEVREYVAQAFPSASRELQFYADVAGRANNWIRSRIEATGKRPSLYGSSAAFRECGRLAVQLYLAERGLIPRGMDPQTYYRDLSFRANEELRTQIAGLRQYDENADGVLSEDDRRARGYTASVRR